MTRQRGKEQADDIQPTRITKLKRILKGAGMVIGTVLMVIPGSIMWLYASVSVAISRLGKHRREARREVAGDEAS